MEHALGTRMFEAGAALLEDNAERLLFQGRFELITQLFEKIPESVVRPRWRLRLAYLWALTLTGRSKLALRLLQVIETERRVAAINDDLLAETRRLRVFLLSTLDRQDEAYTIVRNAMHDDNQASKFSFNVLATTISMWKVATDAHSEAIALLNYTVDERDPSPNVFPRIQAVRLEGSVDLVQGRIRQAIANFRVALQHASAANYASRSTACHLASALYEVDELDEAKEVLSWYLQGGCEYVQPDVTIMSNILGVRLTLASGDKDAAFLQLSEFEYLGRSSGLPRVLAAAHLERVRVALTHNDVSQAELYYALACHPVAWSGQGKLVLPANDVECLQVSRFRLAARKAVCDRDLRDIRSEINRARGRMRHRRALKLKILYSALLRRAGQERAALRTLSEAVSVAAGERMVRTFVEEGPLILEMLDELYDLRRAHQQLDEDEVLLFLRMVLGTARKPLDDADGPGRQVGEGVALSCREAQVLRWVGEGLSDVDIAKALLLAPSTVRTHLRRIYSKLGVANRVQAARQGRRLGLFG